jgi:5-methylcytosine-specific restriction endonuclease McrA
MLDRQVLVLNRRWRAIHFCSVRRALTLVFQELARVVSDDFQTYDFESWRELSQFANGASHLIHTPAFQLLLPQVIVLMQYQSVPPHTVRFNRRNIFLRDRYTCQYCGRKPAHEELTIDHVVPRSRGGRTVWENVVLACSHCNNVKSHHLPGECSMRLSRLPKKPHWTLVHCNIRIDDDNRSLWQKFIDTAYWETNLKE